MNIRIKRYPHPNPYDAFVEPDDGSWILFIRRDGKDPELWTKVISTTVDGDTIEGYMPAALVAAAKAGDERAIDRVENEFWPAIRRSHEERQEVPT